MQVRRGAVVVATIAAVGAGALAIGAVGIVAAGEPTERPVGAAAGGVGSAGAPTLDREVADGYRLVGHGRLALAVPEKWATDAVECNGQPLADTVVNPMREMCAMASSPARDVTAVELGRGWRSAQEPGEPSTLRREATSCDDAEGLPLCSAVVSDGACPPPPQGFVDGIRLGGNHTGNQGGSDVLDDARIRAGETISLAVGESFWLYADPVVWTQEEADRGGAAPTPAGGRITAGDSLERVNLDRREVAQWAAVRPGTSTVVMTVVDAAGVEHDAGTVTVEVTG